MASIFDSDTLDVDDRPTIDRVRNLGGRRFANGEEAHLVVELQGGREHAVIVGAGTESGQYTQSVRQVNR